MLRNGWTLWVIVVLVILLCLYVVGCTTTTYDGKGNVISREGPDWDEIGEAAVGGVKLGTDLYDRYHYGNQYYNPNPTVIVTHE